MTLGRLPLWCVIGFVLIVAVTFGLAMVAVHFSAGDSIDTRIGTVIAVVAFGASAIGWLWGLAQRVRAPSLSLQRAADELAAHVRRQWDRVAAEQGLTHPALIPVQWQWSSGVTSPIAEVPGESGGMWCEPLPGMAAVTAEQLCSGTGTLTDLHRVYGGLGSGRLIVLGQPGAGKSSAGMLLLRAALAHRARVKPRDRSRVPVPVLVTPQGWDPTGEPFAEWLATSLVRDYDLLRAPEYGRDAAMGLIEGGHLAVILDGFDEIPEALRPAALRALDEQASFRLVVLARTGEFQRAVRGGPLRGAAALELRSIDSGQAAQYLASGLIDPPPAPWQRVIDHLREPPEGSALAPAVTTPLMLTLLRDTYRSGDKVDELLERCQFPTGEAVQDHLLDRLLTGAYAQHPTYTVDQARRWLGQLARWITEDGTRDLAWWRIPRWVPAWPRGCATVIVLGLVSALLVGSLVHLHLLPVFQAGPLTALATVFSWGFGYAFMFGPGLLQVSPLDERSPLQRERPRWSRTDILMILLLSAGAGVGTGFQNALGGGRTIGLLMGLVSSFVIGLGFVLGGGPPQRLGWLRWNSTDTRTDRTNLCTGLVVGFAAGFVVGLGYGYAYGLVTGLKYGFLVGIGYLLVIVLGGRTPPQHGQLRCGRTTAATTLLMGFIIAVVSTGGYGIIYVLVVMLGGQLTPQHSQLRGGRTPVPMLLSGLVAGPLLVLWNWFVTGTEPHLIFDLAVGLGFGLTTGILLAVRPLTGPSRLLDPLSLWHQERHGGLVTGLVTGLVVGLVYGFGYGSTDGLCYGVVAGLGSGLVSSVAWAAALASAQLKRRDNTPPHLLRFLEGLLQFLEDAHQRQILRTVGPVYQFRDAWLQKRLTDEITCRAVIAHQVEGAGPPVPAAARGQRG